jgi:hypothetical protein
MPTKMEALASRLLAETNVANTSTALLTRARAAARVAKECDQLLAEAEDSTDIRAASEASTATWSIAGRRYQALDNMLSSGALLPSAWETS